MHTLETLMNLVSDYESPDDLRIALQEVLAERDTAHMDGYEGGKQESRDAAHAERDANARDAARYNWLKNSDKSPIGGYSAKSIDNMIDGELAAMKGQTHD